MTSVIVHGARTPMGRLSGNLKDLPGTKPVSYTHLTLPTTERG